MNLYRRVGMLPAVILLAALALLVFQGYRGKDSQILFANFKLC